MIIWTRHEIMPVPPLRRYRQELQERWARSRQMVLWSRIKRVGTLEFWCWRQVECRPRRKIHVKQCRKWRTRTLRPGRSNNPESRDFDVRWVYHLNLWTETLNDPDKDTTETQTSWKQYRTESGIEDGMGQLSKVKGDDEARTLNMGSTASPRVVAAADQERRQHQHQRRQKTSYSRFSNQSKIFAAAQ